MEAMIGGKTMQVAEGKSNSCNRTENYSISISINSDGARLEDTATINNIPRTVGIITCSTFLITGSTSNSNILYVQQ